MAHRSHAARRHADLAWITFGISDELRDRPGRNRRVHHHNVGLAADGRDRRDVAYEIEIELVVKRRVPRVSRSNLQQRVAVRWRFQLPTIFAPTCAPNSISVKRDNPRHITMLP